MAVRALRVQTEARRTHGREAEMKLRHAGVAGVAGFRDPLMRQQVAVRRAMRAVAGRAAFDARGRVLEHERPALIGMTIRALLLFEAAQPEAALGRMRIVTGDALERSLLETMPFVETELRENLGMAIEADCRLRADWRALLGQLYRVQ